MLNNVDAIKKKLYNLKIKFKYYLKLFKYYYNFIYLIYN